jgi:uncharacterized protein
VSLWATADIHASRTDPDTGEPEKPMDQFGLAWHRHVIRLETAWHRMVADSDTVLVVGDTEWAMHPDDAMETLRRIGSWPGRKILVRGNHDYWWSSKTTNKVRSRLPLSMELLHNNALRAEGFNICGTKGSPVPGGIDWTADNAKLLNREEQRLSVSLAAADPDLPSIVAMHYPPFYPSQGTSPFRDLLEASQVQACVYGHLHGEASRGGPSGKYGSVTYSLVSGDAHNFRPVLLARSGEIILDRSPLESPDTMNT